MSGYIDPNEPTAEQARAALREIERHQEHVHGVLHIKTRAGARGCSG